MFSVPQPLCVSRIQASMWLMLQQCSSWLFSCWAATGEWTAFSSCWDLNELLVRQEGHLIKVTETEKVSSYRLNRLSRQTDSRLCDVKASSSACWCVLIKLCWFLHLSAATRQRPKPKISYILCQNVRLRGHSDRPRKTTWSCHALGSSSANVRSASPPRERGTVFLLICSSHWTLLRSKRTWKHFYSVNLIRRFDLTRV